MLLLLFFRHLYLTLKLKYEALVWQKTFNFPNHTGLQHDFRNKLNIEYFHAINDVVFNIFIYGFAYIEID